MVKHKLDIMQKAGNYIVLHKELLECKPLAQKTVVKHVTGLQKRLNFKRSLMELTLLKAKQGFQDTCIIENIDLENEEMWLRRILKDNLTCIFLLKARS